MKNLPEEQFWSKVGERLANYEEEPGDDWDRIAAFIPRSPSWAERWNKTSDTSILILLAFVIGFGLGNVNQESEGNLNTSDLSQKNNERVVRKQGDNGNEGFNDKKSVTLKPNSVSSSTEKEIIAEDQLREKMAMPNQNPATVNRVVTGLKNNGPGYIAYDQKQESLGRENGSVQPQGETDVVKNERTLATEKNSEDTLVVSQARDSLVAKTKKPQALPKATEEKKKRLHANVFFAVNPTLSYYKIAPRKDDEVLIQRLNSPGIFSSDRAGFAIQAGLIVPVSKRVEVSAGLSYSQQQPSISYSYSSDALKFQQQQDQFTFALSPEVATHSFSYRMRNVGASAGVFYHLYGTRLMHKPGVAVFYQRGLLKAKAGDTYNNSQSSYMGYQLMYRLEFPFKTRSTIFVQPDFSYSFYSKEALNEPLTIKPYRAGVSFGWVWHF